jgi:hypothetical protein
MLLRNHDSLDSQSINDPKKLACFKKKYIGIDAQICGTWPRVQLDFVWWHLIFSAGIAVDFPLIYRNVDQFTCTKQKAPDVGTVLSSLQKCGFSGRNLLHVASPISEVLSGLYTVWASVDPCA